MRRGVRLKRLKYRHNADGSVRVYYCHPGGGYSRLPNLPENDRRFLDAYASAASAEPPRKAGKAPKGSLAELIIAYRGSRAWRAELAPSTRESRTRILDRIGMDRGTAPLDGIRPRHIRADIDGLRPHPARLRLKVWRALMNFGVETGRIEESPAAAVRPPAAATIGHRAWMADEIAAFRARWAIGTTQRLALEIAQWTGARRADLVRLGWQNLGEDGWLTYRQRKTGEAVEIPMRCDLPASCAGLEEDWQHMRAALDACPADRLLWLATAQRKARSDKAFGGWFAVAVRSAGLHGISLHGLRKSRAAALAMLGWSPSQIGAWTGHTSLSEVQHYTREARRRALIEGTEQKRKTGTRTRPRASFDQ